MSYGHKLGGRTYSEQLCQGKSGYAKKMNRLFELGILPIISAGNDYGTSTSCTVSEPGAAIGAFTVAAYGNFDNERTVSLYDRSENVKNLRTANLMCSDAEDKKFYCSATGGVDIPKDSNLFHKYYPIGKYRTIVDIAAPGCREYVLAKVDTGYIPKEYCGTSFAAPTVTAAAIDFIDFFKATFDDSIDEPGLLFVNLLLMGDRMSSESGYLTNGYDRSWGAGRLKMRMPVLFENLGGFATYFYGSFCVENGKRYSYDIRDGDAMPIGTNSMKIAMWWYSSVWAETIHGLAPGRSAYLSS